MKLKKFIAVLLSGIMTVSAAALNSVATFAASKNTVNKTMIVKNGDSRDDMYLKLQPESSIEIDDTINITLKNASFKDVDFANYQYTALSDAAYGWEDKYNYFYDYLKNEYNENFKYQYNSAIIAFDNTLSDLMRRSNSVELPYKIKKVSDDTISVNLFALPDVYAGEKFADINVPAYKIPIPFTATGEGDLVICVNGENTGITSANYKIADIVSKEGKTEATADQISLNNEKSVFLPSIYIKESIYGTFKPGEKVTLSAGNGRFIPKNTSESLSISPGINADFTTLEAINIPSDNTLEFTIPRIDSTNAENNFQSKKAAAINISGLCYEADEPGDIEITISGESAGITQQTINMGTYTAGIYDKNILTAKPAEAVNVLKTSDLSLILYKPEAIDVGSEIYLTVPEGFKFVKGAQPYVSCENMDLEPPDISIEDNKITFKVNDYYYSSDVPPRLIFNNILIESADGNKKGDVHITISEKNGGIPEQTVLVGSLKEEENKPDEKPVIIAPVNLSENSINKTVKVMSGDSNNETTLKIMPTNPVNMGDTIVINFENAIIVDTDLNYYYQYSALNSQISGWEDNYDTLYDYLENEYNDYLKAYNNEATAFRYTLEECMMRAQTVDLPYKIRRINNKSMEVQLFAIPDTYAGQKFAEVNKPIYKIPLPFTATGEGNVKISIDNNETSIASSEHIIGELVQSDLEATITPVSFSKETDSSVSLNPLKIKQPAHSTTDNTLNIKLNNGYKFSSDTVQKLSQFNASINEKNDNITITIPAAENSADIKSIEGISVLTGEGSGDITINVYGDYIYYDGLIAAKLKKASPEKPTEPDTGTITDDLYHKMEERDLQCDFDGDNTLTANDAAILLRRVNDKNFVYPEFKDLIGTDKN